MRRVLATFGAGALSFLAVPGLLAAVVISEIHYHPIEGESLEFVELHNPDSEPVDLSGWRLRRGVRFEFAPGTTLAPDGRLVVCRNPIAVARRFGLEESELLGSFLGLLENGGESVSLEDARGLTVDRVSYDDDAPWPSAADGLGPALARRCASFDSNHPWNWVAAPPSPLTVDEALGVCPPPPLPPPAIAIHEIHYHELDDQPEELEFVELINATEQPISLLGYRFTQGFAFEFTEDRILAPGELIVVCRNRQALIDEYSVDPARIAGEFVGQLSNDGERITLVDASGTLVDSVRYGDRGDWPVAADGLGFSLEKIVARAPSDDPRSWGPAEPGAGGEWVHIELRGPATSDRLFVYFAEPGRGVFDDFSLVLLDADGNPGEELLPDGSFDVGLGAWSPAGNHETSEWVADGGQDGSGAMQLISTGRGSGRTNGISVESLVPLDRDPALTYRLRFSYRLLEGELLTVRLSGSSPSRGLYHSRGVGETVSPGARNGATRAALPPFIESLSRFPRQPTSTDSVFVTARVRGENLTGVRLLVEIVGGDSFEAPMSDAGLAGDGLAGDGIFGAELPPAAHGSQVTFRILTESATAGAREFPAPHDPAGVFGYFVEDDAPDSPLPVYHLLVDPLSGRNARSIIAALNCSSYAPASFAFEGDLYPGAGIRRRGQSVCGDGNVIKKYLKLNLPRGRSFSRPLAGGRVDVDKINLQSLWTDKSLIRENMAWSTFRSIGSPAMFHEFVRLHVNGAYFGLYAEMEHPDARFLANNRLNPDGNLYKATASREERTGSNGSVQASYEKKTNENGDFSDLADFLAGLHDTPRTQLVDFFSARTDEDAMLEYQMGQVLTNNRDYPHKNHYLYHDTARGKWMPIAWDMDLVFGKRWDGNNRGVLNDLMDTPGTTPWYTTSVRGEGTGNHLLDKFFSQSGTHYRRAYIVRLWDALHEKYTEELFEDSIRDYRALLLEEQALDIAAWGRSPASPNDRSAPAEFDPNLDRVRQHVRVRREYLLNYLRNTEGFRGHDRLKITELQYNPADEADVGEYVELWNNSGGPIDVGGWSVLGLGRTLEDGTREEYFFPEGTLIAENEVFCLAKDPVAFGVRYGDVGRVLGPYPGNLANDGEELRVRDAGPGHPATVDYLRYGAEAPWPVRPDGLGYSLELTDVSADRDNDLAENWRSSLAPGGTPGRVEGVNADATYFRRGDCDADGFARIQDATAILLYLFGGQTEISCWEACDVDASRDVNLSDAVFLLEFLFRGAPRPIPSPGPQECGPGDPFTCETSICEPTP